MKNTIKNIVLTLSALLASVTSPTQAATGIPLAQAVDQIIHRYNPNVNIAVYAESINTGEAIYQKNPNQLLTPASSLKTVTATAALDYLGPDYRFQTQALSTSPTIHQGILNGDIYFYFDGDPTLRSADLENMVEKFVRKGLHVIQGDVYIDTTIFDQTGEAPGWLEEDRNFCYAAPVAAVSLDRNCAPVTIFPSRKGNSRPRISSVTGINVLNSLTSAYGGCTFDIDGNANNSYNFTGCINSKARPISIGVAVRNEPLFAQNTLIEILAKHNIKVTGNFKFAKTPANVKLYMLDSHSSAPLSSVVKVMLKKSDNLYANSLYKKLGYTYTGNPGSWTNGYQAIKGILNHSGINFSHLKMVDGSGLSRNDAVSAHELVNLLKYAYRDNKIQDPFFNALGISGVDGHLQNRMVKLRNRIHAKTGTMHGITSLAGYIFTDNNQVLAFAIIINDFTENVHKYQNLEDAICSVLARVR